MSISAKRSEAARRNGARSRGPVTAEGKQRSSQNAITHGMYTDLVMLRNENPEAWRELCRQFVDFYQPRNFEEATLVEDMIACRWRILRCRSLQTAGLQFSMDEQEPALNASFEYLPEATRTLLACHDAQQRSAALLNLERQEQRLVRMFERARLAFHKVRGNPLPDPGPLAPCPVSPSPDRAASDAVTTDGAPPPLFKQQPAGPVAVSPCPPADRARHASAPRPCASPTVIPISSHGQSPLVKTAGGGGPD